MINDSDKLIANRTMITGVIKMASKYGPALGMAATGFAMLSLIDYMKEVGIVSSMKVAQGDFGDNVGRRM